MAEGIFPHLFNVVDNYNYIGHLHAWSLEVPSRETRASTLVSIAQLLAHFTFDTKHHRLNSTKRLQTNQEFFQQINGMDNFLWKVTGVSYQDAWANNGENYLKDAKVWAEAYYKSPHNKYIMSFTEFHFHGYQLC